MHKIKYINQENETVEVIGRLCSDITDTALILLCEDDIVIDLDNNLGTIMWHSYHSKFVVDFKNTQLELTRNKFTKIGNIKNNPELLEAKYKGEKYATI